MNKKFIINLANENLTDGEISVLGRGLNFIDVLRDPNMLYRDTDMYRSIHEKNAHRYLMANKKGKRNHRFKSASSWHPLSTPSLDLETYFESTRLELSKTKLICIHDNLTKPERQALKSLRKKKHLVFQKPDKSRGVVIINKHDYIHEGETMLKGNQYTEIYTDRHQKQ